MLTLQSEFGLEGYSSLPVANGKMDRVFESASLNRSMSIDGVGTTYAVSTCAKTTSVEYTCTRMRKRENVLETRAKDH